jgi:hypothetical protein
MKNADFPFDLGLRARSGQDDFTVCAYAGINRKELCGGSQHDFAAELIS